MIKVRNFAALLAIVQRGRAARLLDVRRAIKAGRRAAPSFPSQSYPSPQSQELTQDTTQQVQERLQQQGIYRGRVDGVWGPGTEAAVRSYQQQHNLNPTGKLDVDTLSSLNLGTSQNYGSAQQPGDQRYGSNYNPPPEQHRTSRTPDTHADTGARDTSSIVSRGFDLGHARDPADCQALTTCFITDSASSTCAAVTSRCRQARARYLPEVETSTPSLRSLPANASAVMPVPLVSKNTRLVSGISTVMPGICAMPRASDFALA